MDIKNFESGLSQKQFPIDWPGHWIDGAWVPIPKAKIAKASLNPNDGKKLIEVQADKTSLMRAMDTASAARQFIAETPLKERLAWLANFRQCLADFQMTATLALQIEAGKPSWEAREDVHAALAYLDNISRHGEEITENLTTSARSVWNKGSFKLVPIGIAIAYMPFSTPLTSLAVLVSAAALAGCPLIIMPSSHAVLTALLGGMIDEAISMPKGFLSMVFGNFVQFRQALSDKRVAAVIFQGSREHCEVIRQESRAHLGRQLVLQSGGKNSIMVHSSADLDLAVKCTTFGAFRSAGQLCTSTSRVFVYRNMAATFLEKLVSATSHMRIDRTDLNTEGDGPFMGPVYAQKAVEKFLRFQTMANREAKETLLWGRAEAKGGGFFVKPGIHVMNQMDPASAYQTNVLFTPDIAIYEYDELEPAIDQVNTTDAPFVVSFIGDKQIMESRRHLFHAPNLLVNAPTVEMEASLPLSGRLHSGNFRLNGPGIAAHLTWPQGLSESQSTAEIIKRWPWPMTGP